MVVKSHSTRADSFNCHGVFAVTLLQGGAAVFCYCCQTLNGLGYCPAASTSGCLWCISNADAL